MTSDSELLTLSAFAYPDLLPKFEVAGSRVLSSLYPVQT